MDLFDDQIEFIQNLRKAFIAKKSIIGQAATGFGKSYVACYLCKSSIAKNKRVFFMVHRRSLALQISKEFKKNDVPHSFIASELPHVPDRNIYAVMLQTLVSKLHKFQPPDLLIYDEAHTSQSETGTKIIKWVLDNGGKVLGLSATPEPTNGNGLGKQFEEIICSIPTDELIKKQRLAPYDIYCPDVTPDFSGVPIVKGDYSQEKIEEIINTPKITGDALVDYQRLAAGKACVVFCSSVKHAYDVAEQFNRADYKFVAIDAHTSDEDREKAFDDLANRRIHGITNYGICIEGVDIPLVECVIMLRATLSIIVWLQACGRSLRYLVGKRAIILDQTGNVFRLGTPCMKREWTLEAKKKRKSSDAAPPMPLRHCKGCKAIYDAALTKCPRCGSTHVILPKEIKTRKGKLAKVDPEQIAALLEKRKQEKLEDRIAKTYDEYLAIGIKRGYKKPKAWAFHKSKHKKK